MPLNLEQELTFLKQLFKRKINYFLFISLLFSTQAFAVKEESYCPPSLACTNGLCYPETEGFYVFALSKRNQAFVADFDGAYSPGSGNTYASCSYKSKESDQDWAILRTTTYLPDYTVSDSAWTWRQGKGTPWLVCVTVDPLRCPFF
jgi:hypothetical protein